MAKILIFMYLCVLVMSSAVQEASAADYSHLKNTTVFVREPVAACDGKETYKTYHKYQERGFYLDASNLMRNGSCFLTRRESDIVILGAEEYTKGRSDLLLVEVKDVKDKRTHTGYYTLYEN
jgi:hypothetical protein